MSKNIGQVAGLFIGTTAPTNTALIWYDSSSHAHKVYNTSLGAWTVLDQQSITSITYSGLVNRASTTGLTQGQWFKITDRSNALALAITSTKVQYADNSGALVINDLGTNIQYHITSGNLLIDNISGVYNTSTGKLVFSFEEGDPIMDINTTNVDYIMGISKRGNTRSLKKWKFSKLLSSNANNDISWASGFFLNFGEKLRSFFDVQGGVVSKEVFDNFQQTQQQTIQQIAHNEQLAIQQIANTIAQATDAVQIYSKQLPTAPTTGVAADIVQGDTLSTIVNKIQRWITTFKIATGIKVSSSFAPAPTPDPINNTDTVDNALRKVQKNINDLKSIDFSGETQKVGTTSIDVPTEEPSEITEEDTIKEAIEKLLYWVNNISTNQIADGAVTTDKIADLAVATAKLADLAVTAAKIANGAITTPKLGYKSITEEKLALGVQNTDICRLDVEVSFPQSAEAAVAILTNMSVGFCLVAGDSGPFAYDATDANNPYRISSGLIIVGQEDFPIISFAPVLAPQNNSEKDFSIAAIMPHYKGHYSDEIWGGDPELVGMYFQSQILLSQALYDDLYRLGYRYVYVTITRVDLYGNTSIVVSPKHIQMNRVNIWGFAMTLAQINAGSDRHIIIKIQVSFSATA